MRFRNLILGGMAALLVGCVTMPATTYQPSIDNTQALLRDGKSRLAVDAFAVAKDVDNKSLSVRGSQLTGGSDGTFSTYLRDAIQAELQTAGRYDAASATRISGTLTGNELDGSGVSTGHAKVSARFVVMRQQTKVYDKELTATHQWDSSFIGAIAIPAAMQNYTTTVQKLIGLLLADPDFVKVSSESGAQ